MYNNIKLYSVLDTVTGETYKVIVPEDKTVSQVIIERRRRHEDMKQILLKLRDPAYMKQKIADRVAKINKEKAIHTAAMIARVSKQLKKITC